MAILDSVRATLLETLSAGERAGYSGHSKFDALESPIVRGLSLGWWPLRLLWTQLVTRSPVDLRPWLRVAAGVNPEAPALFARANLDCLGAGLAGPFAERATRALDWLLEHDAARSGRYHGSCWGYHHAWQSPGFYQPPHYPNCYMTTIVAGALLHGHRVLGKSEYLAAAERATDFVLRDLPVLREDAEEKCIGYVPDVRASFVVINVNALAAALLAEVASQAGRPALLEEARRLMTFVTRCQTDYGAWHYTLDPRQSLVAHDNYHTGMILDALLAYERASGDGRFRAAFASGLDFYRALLFLPDGAPKWTSTRVRPHDVHGSAQGTLTFALAGELDTAARIAAWGIDRFYKGDGAFAYQSGGLVERRFSLLHWGSGWMARGLAALLLAERERVSREVSGRVRGSSEPLREAHGLDSGAES